MGMSGADSCSSLSDCRVPRSLDPCAAPVDADIASSGLQMIVAIGKDVSYQQHNSLGRDDVGLKEKDLFNILYYNY